MAITCEDSRPPTTVRWFKVLRLRAFGHVAVQLLRALRRRERQGAAVVHSGGLGSVSPWAMGHGGRLWAISGKKAIGPRGGFGFRV